VDLEHELDQRVFEASALALDELEPAARHFRAALEVQHVEFLAQVVVGDDLRGQVAQVIEPPAVDLDVVGFVVADRRTLVGDVRQFQHPLVEFRLQFLGALLDLLEVGLEFLRALDGLLGLLLVSGLFEFADFAADLVALVPQFVAAGFQFSPLFVECDDLVDVDAVDAFHLDRPANPLGVLAEQRSVEHSCSAVPGRVAKPCRCSGNCSRALPELREQRRDEPLAAVVVSLLAARARRSRVVPGVVLGRVVEDRVVFRLGSRFVLLVESGLALVVDVGLVVDNARVFGVVDNARVFGVVGDSVRIDVFEGLALRVAVRFGGRFVQVSATLVADVRVGTDLRVAVMTVSHCP